MSKDKKSASVCASLTLETVATPWAPGSSLGDVVGGRGGDGPAVAEVTRVTLVPGEGETGGVTVVASVTWRARVQARQVCKEKCKLLQLLKMKMVIIVYIHM